MAAKTTDKELFPMRISSPPPELSGEALAQKVPKEWNSKGSIYADQFLSHLCPPDLDEEQRRQFFCILDLRRLKYAANEIFARKDWKLNVINFAKEFEKSRSIILLRYGLYEFQNVKPSKEVLKRWRREHGLPEPEDEQDEAEAPAPTPSKAAPSKKRKADDGLTKDSAEGRVPQPSEKRQTRSKVGQEDPAPISTPEPAGKNKRKASAGEADQPAKRSTPSATKALFEKIANKPATSAEQSAPAAPKPNLFAANKSSTNNLARSVFTNIKSGAGQAQAPASTNANIFGYLSDASSAKNSGAEGDADSETDSEEDDSQEAEETEEPSGDASAAEAEESAVATGTGVSTRESTPGRSIFDRVTKGNDGQPVRTAEAEAPTAEKPASADQTWNPSTTPLKFAPSSTSGSIFGKSDASAANGSSIFAPKSTAPSNLFGAAKQDASSEKKAPAAETDKDGGESDKENDSQPAKKPMFEAKPSAPAGQQPFGSLFQQKPASATSETPFGPAKPAANLFGGASKTAAPDTSNLFGPATSKPAGSEPVMQSSTLFGANPSEPAKAASEEPSAPNSGVSTPATGEQPATTAPSLFGAKPVSTAAPSTNLFGAGSTVSTATPTAAPASLFGASSAPKSDAPASGSSTPVFSFGGNTTGTSTAAPAQKPLFGAPKSPPAGNNTSNMFGSPMKQDDHSPAKKQFTGASATGSAASAFSFGGASSAPSTNIFGGATNNATTNGNNTSLSFGSDNSANAGSGNFGFHFSGGGDKSATTSFNNPFTSGGAGGSSSAAPSTGGMFNFGGSSAPSSGASTPFQFGGASGNTAAPSGAPAFGGNQAANNSTPMFGGASTGSSSAFNFTAAPTSQPQASGSIFGANQAAPAFLAPPAGGSSTTGTSKSQFPHRKIAPLKRRK
jgi:tubulin gamma